MPLATPDDIVAALKDYGCRVHEWDGWRTRGRPYEFNPYGQAWHHDAFSESYPDIDAARYLAEIGRSDLRPPLSNGAIGNYSTIYLLAYGNANHAGWNIASVHQRLRAGRAPIGDARHITESDTVVGNPHLWGWECRNAGTGHDPWDQLDAMERAGAAMADCCSWTPMASAAHRELTRRKIDPAGFDMHAFRADIAQIITAHHATRPPALEDDDMFIIWDLHNPQKSHRGAWLLAGGVMTPLPGHAGFATVGDLVSKGVPEHTPESHDLFVASFYARRLKS